MTTRIKFICLNLWLGGKLFENIVSFLREEQPDIIALQEVYNEEDDSVPVQLRSLRSLQSALNIPHHIFAATFRHVAEQGGYVRGNAILSRYPIEQVRVTFFDIPYTDAYDVPPLSGDHTREPRNLQHGIAHIGGKQLHVFNTQGIWGFDGKDNPRRHVMAQIIAAEVAGKKPVILAGDLNVREQTKTVASIEKQMRNVFRGQLTTSFNMHHKQSGGFGSAVVDMVFISDDIKVLETRVSNADVSDHPPLICELEF